MYAMVVPMQVDMRYWPRHLVEMVAREANRLTARFRPKDCVTQLKEIMDLPSHHRAVQYVSYDFSRHYHRLEGWTWMCHGMLRCDNWNYYRSSFLCHTKAEAKEQVAKAFMRYIRSCRSVVRRPRAVQKREREELQWNKLSADAKRQRLDAELDEYRAAIPCRNGS